MNYGLRGTWGSCSSHEAGWRKAVHEASISDSRETLPQAGTGVDKLGLPGMHQEGQMARPAAA